MFLILVQDYHGKHPDKSVKNLLFKMSILPSEESSHTSSYVPQIASNCPGISQSF